MSTREQIAANRRNAKLSRGPKTEEGKAKAAKNSLKHGVLSRNVLLVDEDAGAFSELAERLQATLKPDGELEAALVERIIELIWRLRRLGKIENAVLVWQRLQLAAKQLWSSSDASYSASDIVREAAKKEGVEKLVLLGQAFVSGEDSLAKLSRYETSIERSLYKALHELERRQAARLGEHLPPPVAADIDVTGLAER